MGDLILEGGELTPEADIEFEKVAEETGLKPEIVKAMALELRIAINEAGGFYCPDDKADEIWAAIQRRHGVPEHRIEPPHLRRQ